MGGAVNLSRAREKSRGSTFKIRRSLPTVVGKNGAAAQKDPRNERRRAVGTAPGKIRGSGDGRLEMFLHFFD